MNATKSYQVEVRRVVQTVDCLDLLLLILLLLQCFESIRTDICQPACYTYCWCAFFLQRLIQLIIYLLRPALRVLLESHLRSVRSIVHFFITWASSDNFPFFKLVADPVVKFLLIVMGILILRLAESFRTVFVFLGAYCFQIVVPFLH